MNQKKHKTEDLGNWKPFVEQLHKEWEKVKSEQVDENLELKEKTWKRVDRKIFSPRRYILRAGWAVAAALVGVMLYWGYKIPEKHEIKSVAYIEHSYVEGRMYILPDSSTVWLEPESKIRISSDFLSKREVWLTGSSVFEVKKKANTDFKVYINTACIEVKGTVFSVNQPTLDTSIIALYEGAIDFVGKNQSLISMAPSQRLVYDVHTGSTLYGAYNEAVFSMVGENGRKALRTKWFRHVRENGLNISKRFFSLHGLTSALRLRGFSADLRAIALHRACRWG